MTEQEAFDKAVRGLASQGFQTSIIPKDDEKGWTESCAYLSPEGRRCAAGWLLEGIRLIGIDNRCSIQFLIAGNAEVRERLAGLSNTFIWRLQKAHDDAHWAYEAGAGTRNAMIGKLRDFALDYKLSTMVLDEVGVQSLGRGPELGS